MAIKNHLRRALAFFILLRVVPSLGVLSAGAGAAGPDAAGHRPAQAQDQTSRHEQAGRHAQAGLPEIQSYISSAWDTLTRSMTSCQSITDPKASTPPVIYLPADFATPAELEPVTRECHAQIAHLPRVIRRLGEIDVKGLDPHALLYLPHPYVVPGGMFNEMYGWDSYFIIRGLVEDGKLDLAQGMVEDFFFELDHYGGIHNANRGYFLTRSQPPFLTSMVLAVYDAKKKQGHEDHAWLEKAYAYAVKDYGLWTHAPHLAGETGLSRYYDFGSGPVPELAAETNDYYGGALAYFLSHPNEADRNVARAGDADLTGPVFSILLCPPGSDEKTGQGCRTAENAGLAKKYYEGDRAM